MIELNKRYEERQIGDLTASELHELASYITIKNVPTSGLLNHFLMSLIHDAKSNPSKRVWKYVQESIQTKDHD